MEAYRAKILVVDDEEGNLLAMEKILSNEAYLVSVARQSAPALNLFRRQNYDLVITDLRMPGLSGLELLRAIRKECASVPVVVLTAFGTVADAVEAMKLGAVDFLSKPLRKEVLLKCVQDNLHRKNSGGPQRPQFFGNSPEIVQIKRSIRMLAKTSASVLINGESGTGKEVVARTIHQESARAGRLISVNCGAIPDNLLESELFGFDKGAFTGALFDKPGLFEAADRGTLFLDEIGEMPMLLQVKLLRVLQDGVFYRLGSTISRKSDVRIVAATNSDLSKKISDGKFREDLYYRLNVVSLNLPPLRERTEDISGLANYFLELAKETYGKKMAMFLPSALEAIASYRWPGNIRELRNTIERTLVLLEGNEIGPEHLGVQFQNSVVKKAPNPEIELRFPLGTSLEEMERIAILKTLDFTGGDKQRAAEILGINQRTIYRRLAETSRN